MVRTVPYIGFIISGKAHVERIDYWENRSLYEALLPGSIFSEIYACGDYPLNIQITSAAKTEIMLFDMRLLKNTRLDSPGKDNATLPTLKSDFYKDFFSLWRIRLIFCHGKWSGRALLNPGSCVLLFKPAGKPGRIKQLDIPLNRQELADHLFVDRSALSNALSKMQKAGLLSFKHNHFKLLAPL